MKTAFLTMVLCIGVAVTGCGDPDTGNGENQQTIYDSFIRGDVNDDGQVDISDVSFLYDFLFNGGSAPPCPDAADVNDDGNIDISDAQYLPDFLFAGGQSSIPSPYPAVGLDETSDLLNCRNASTTPAPEPTATPGPPPPEIDGKFVRGDMNDDGQVDISDVIGMFAFLFDGGAPPRCQDAADINDDGSIDISDAQYLPAFLFTGQQTEIPAPYPAPSADPTVDALDCRGVEDVVNTPPTGPVFLRGDANADGQTDISDPQYILNWLFNGGPAPPCLDAADVNDDGTIDITDPTVLNGFLFSGNPTDLPEPSPSAGTDPTADTLGCETSL